MGNPVWEPERASEESVLISIQVGGQIALFSLSLESYVLRCLTVSELARSLRLKISNNLLGLLDMLGIFNRFLDPFMSKSGFTH
jgi:hypothetical protein